MKKSLLILAFLYASPSAFAEYFCSLTVTEDGKQLGVLHGDVPDHGSAEGTLDELTVQNKRRKKVKLSLKGKMTDGTINAKVSMTFIRTSLTTTETLEVTFAEVKGSGYFNVDQTSFARKVTGHCETLHLQ